MPEAGTMLLHYRLVEKLGEGGMGVVWKAADTTLGRDVAIKILPEAFASEADRLSRFEREAKALAALNHPHIAAVYGLHEAGGVRFIAMELAPGEELMRLLKRGPVSIDDALKIARAVASALEAAHDAGIVHRDLKPANIMVAPDGGVKVLDFGLAKSFETESGATSGSMSPTLTTPATRAGVIMGTAAYMSPEQARGKPVDKRTDIWAFGVVLWEMLAGDRAFKGETVSDMLASILKESPDLGALPASTPAPVRRLISRCLEKDPKARLRDIGEARILLSGDLREEVARPGVEAGAPPRKASRAVPALLGIAGLLAGALATYALVGREAPEPRPPSMLLSIPLDPANPPGSRLSRPVAISPDGDRIVYVAQPAGDPQIFSKRAGDLDMEPIEGTKQYVDPFFSPDGRKLGVRSSVGLTIGWFDLESPGHFQKLVEGGHVGAVWGADDHVYFTYTKEDAADNLLIHRVPATGGAPEVVTQRAEGREGESHWWPEILPGGRTLLYAAVPAGFRFRDAEIRALDLESGEQKVLIPSAQQARYEGSGHIVYLQKNTLLAVRFDPEKVEITGPPVAILSGVKTNPDSGSAAFAASRNGTLVYLSESAEDTKATIVAYDAQGNASPLVAEPADYRSARASSDGQRLAVSIVEGPGRFRAEIHNLRRKTFSRLRAGSDESLIWPIWSNDGKWIYATRAKPSGRADVVRIPSDGSGSLESLGEVELFDSLDDVSRDGRWLIVASSESGSSDLETIATEAGGDKRPLLATESNEGGARISPDGKWMAYVDDSLGQPEIFLRSFPEPGEAWRISTQGGEAVAWAPDGRRILYVHDQDLFSVNIGSEAEPAPRDPVKLFTLQGPKFNAVGGGNVSLQMLPDDRVMAIRPEASQLAHRIHVVTDWFAELNEQVP